MAQEPARRRLLHPRVALGYLAFVAACSALYLRQPDSDLGSVAYLLPALTSFAAIELGVRRNQPRPRRPWRHLQLAFAGTLGYSIVLVVSPTGQIALVGLAFGGVAYLLLFAWLFGLLRARADHLEEEAAADGVLVALATLLLAWVLLVSPVLAAEEAASPQDLFDGLLPVFDTVLVFLFARAAFLTARGVRALWFAVGGFLLLLLGDLGYALAGSYVLPVRHELLELPYLGLYGLLGAAALHPSMRLLTAPAPPRIRPLGRGRLLLVCFAVAVPAILVFVRALTDPVDRAVVAGGILALACIVLWRTVRAVNQHAASELRLAHQATHDALTELPNRVRLVERLDEALADAPSARQADVAVLFCDLDGFKFVNDSWGHSVGDELLMAVGERLRRGTPGALLVSRVGGDEFVVLCRSGPGDSTATQVADRLLAQFADPFVLSVGEVFVSVSIGIVSSRDQPPDCTPDDLIRDADTAMYRAKAEGRNRWALFDASFREIVRDRLRVEGELRRAIERDELRVHYQPIVRVADGALEGFEALVRWDHPERGMVSPDRFIPVVEDTDLILPVGEFVLRRAVSQLVRWRAEVPAGQDLHVSVNVAARQLRDPAFVDLVGDVLAGSGLPGPALTLEITESTMVEDSEATRQKLEAIRELGVSLSVDDFGTGYSSLRYLKRFPVNAVKIDRAFVDGLGEDPDDEAIVQAVLAMAHALGLAVVAEGVETVPQRDRLRVLGCDSAQGYLFGRPTAAVTALARPGAPAPQGSIV